MTIGDLNMTNRAGFVEALGWVFENSPWVAERAWARRPFESLDVLHDALTSEVASATPDEQLALLCAHPDLGAVRLKPDPTNGSDSTDGGVRLQADQYDMSHASKREQAEAGLDSLSRSDLDRMGALTGAYRDKFGFPFLYAVKGSTMQDILNALETRLPATRDAEIGEALRQVSRIARFRLEDVFS